MEIQVKIKSRDSKKPSLPMRAALLVFNSDPYLMEAAAPYINLETEVISWEKIFRLPLGAGQKAAATWAYGIFMGEQRLRSNCFGAARGMSPYHKVAVLEALCLRWGMRG